MPEYGSRRRIPLKDKSAGVEFHPRNDSRQPSTSRIVEISQRPSNNHLIQRFSRNCPQRLPNPKLCPYGGACHTCPVSVQTKLKINPPGDKYEQEADRVADRVMRMPEPGLGERVGLEHKGGLLQAMQPGEAVTPLVQKQDEPEAVEEEEEPEDEEEQVQASLMVGENLQRQEEPEEEEEEPIQTKPSGSGGGKALPCVRTLLRSMRGGGQPLTTSTRNFFEPRFGNDFSQVRVHAGSRAAAAARGLRARAFTLGRDVFFGAGQLEPGLEQGRRLMGHELTHVVQQGSAPALNRWNTSNRGNMTSLTASRGVQRQPAKVAPKYRFIVDLSSAEMTVKKGSSVDRKVKIYSGGATWTLIRAGRDPGTGKWRYEPKSYWVRKFKDKFVINPKSKPSYTACTWLPWGEEVDGFPSAVGTYPNHIKPPKSKKKYTVRVRGGGSREIQHDDGTWESITRHCNPFGKHYSVIKGQFMLHGTDGNPGGITGAPAARRKLTHGCIRTDNVTIGWIKGIVNAQGSAKLRIKP